MSEVVKISGVVPFWEDARTVQILTGKKNHYSSMQRLQADRFGIRTLPDIDRFQKFMRHWNLNSWSKVTRCEEIPFDIHGGLWYKYDTGTGGCTGWDTIFHGSCIYNLPTIYTHGMQVGPNKVGTFPGVYGMPDHGPPNPGQPWLSLGYCTLLPLFDDGTFWGVCIKCRGNPDARKKIRRSGDRSQYVYPKSEIVIQTVYFIALHVQDYAQKRKICEYASLLQLDFDEMITGGSEVRGADSKSRCRSRSPTPF